MKTETRTPLTLLEACALMARETVSLLDGTADTLDSASEFRNALAFLNSVQDLGDGGALLAWVEAELENSKKFAETGQPYQSLIKLDTLLPLPAPDMQLDAVCVLLQATARQPCTPERWEAMQNAARILTEMDSLEDMVLTGFKPCGGFLTTKGLHNLVEDVQAALQFSRQERTVTNKSKTSLTPLEVCILMAHEAAVLLNTDADALDTAVEFRDALELFGSVYGLKDTDVLLAWIDAELDSARQFAQAREDVPHLIDPDHLLPVPDAAMQMDTIWMLFQVAAQQALTQKQRQTLLKLAQAITDMAGLEDMLLTTKFPVSGFLTPEALRTELEDVRTALQERQTGGAAKKTGPA